MCPSTLKDIAFTYSLISDLFEPAVPAYTPNPAATGYWVILQDNKVLLQPGEHTPELPSGTLPDWLTPPANPLCIGRWQGRPLHIFSLDLDSPIQPPFLTEAINAVEQRMDNATLGIAGLARQILHWEQQSRICGQCGAGTRPFSNGWGTRCDVCSARNYPQISPCAIILVRRDDEVLLVRKAEWPAGRYSLVSGFVGFGESLEDCAAREVREETGIEVTDIRYVGSQSWPFPSQLMTGFISSYAGGELVVDHTELEDACWFSIHALPTLPPPRSIARRIIDAFCV